jgi:hypothetical protein
MKRVFWPLAVSLALAAVALGGNTGCAGDSSGVPGCPAVEVTFQNVGDPTISVTNPSFEDDVLAQGNASTSAPTGWQATGSAYGVYNPNVGNPGAGVNAGTSPEGTDVPDGNQVGYLTGAYFLQNVSTTVQANTTYTLSVYLGFQYEESLPPGYGIELLDPTVCGLGQNCYSVYAEGGNADFNSLFTPSYTVGTSTICTTPTQGNFALCTISFDSAVLPGLVGDELGVALSAPTIGGQLLVDDVHLNYQSDTTPEPGSIGLALLGLGAFTALWRRKSA